MACVISIIVTMYEHIATKIVVSIVMSVPHHCRHWRGRGELYGCTSRQHSDKVACQICWVTIVRVLVYYC